MRTGSHLFTLSSSSNTRKSQNKWKPLSCYLYSPRSNFFGHGCGVIRNIHFSDKLLSLFLGNGRAHAKVGETSKFLQPRASIDWNTLERGGGILARNSILQPRPVYTSWFCFPLHCSVAVFLLNAASRVTCSPLALSRGWRPPKCRWETCVHATRRARL